MSASRAMSWIVVARIPNRLKRLFAASRMRWRLRSRLAAIRSLIEELNIPDEYSFCNTRDGNHGARGEYEGKEEGNRDHAMGATRRIPNSQEARVNRAGIVLLHPGAPIPFPCFH